MEPEKLVSPEQLLASWPFAIVDGGLSTGLELLGYRSQGLLWTAALLVEKPEVVVAAHRSFVEAGAEIIISASYQASQRGFVRAGCSAARARQLLAATTGLARSSGAPLVASSIGPFGATLGDGSEYHGRYAASWQEVRQFHRQRLEVLADTGPDLFAIETIPSRIESEIVAEELASVGSGVPAWLSFSCSDAARTCAGDRFEDAIQALSGAPLLAIGLNCTDPRYATPLLSRAAQVTSLPLVCYPNHGLLWDAQQECWTGHSQAQLASHVPQWFSLGARYIGGCCGIGPDGIRSLVQARASIHGG